ncbi:hypothetical protein D477_001379 [Arthrobacter crystallopoietes BAB-32]|uniref:Uncharacterized protein n=1 Tax=Arthrobacter crystallopoietes BAB-32 TaxID=1246476 RepID=N1VCH6_9MICC|nr:hypothetical protein [Arthrobacter crystallopoietes]EMY35998.1 hypothetical protein D477_001379 [Arthrobacter crystallopoietes BAB-32]
MLGGIITTDAVEASEGSVARRRAHAFLDFLLNHWHQLALALAGLIGFLTAFLNDDSPDWWTPAMFWSYLVLGISGGLGGLLRKPTYAEQAATITRLENDLGEQTALFRGMLDSLMTGLLYELDLYNTQTRISGYIRSGDSYVLLARISKNSAYEKPGRPTYPIGQGLLDDVWNKGTCQRAFPARYDYYLTHMINKFGYDKKTVEAFTMKARSMGGVRAYDDTTRTPVAAIVIEHEDRTTINDALMTRIEDAAAWRTLKTYLTTSTELFPDIRAARSKGF